MSALVNYRGDGDLCPATGSFYSNLMESSLFLSLAPRADMYCPPSKKSRISGSFAFGEDWVQQVSSSIDVLPDECVFEIFRRLPGSQERSICACVSKRWLMLLSTMRRAEICGSRPSISAKDAANPVSDEDKSSELNARSSVSKGEETLPMTGDEEEQEADSDGHLSRCLAGKKATDVRLAAISVGTSSRGGLGKLQIRGNNSVRGVTNRGLTAIARGCPSLRILSLWNISSISDDGLSDIANGCHMIEKLDLCCCPSISDKGMLAIAQNCPNLTSLTIESCSKIGNESLQAIGRCCSNLRSISIKDCPMVGDQGIAALMSSASNVLTKIKFQALNVSDLSLAVIGHYGKAVTDIILSGLRCVSEKGFWVMGSASGLQKLKSLTITSCGGVTDLGLDAVSKGCPNLKHLFLGSCSMVSDEGLITFTRASTSLESLQLEECHRITQVGVISSLSNCGDRLKVLALVKCLGIRDAVSGLASHSPCKSLRSLTISNCPGFGNASLTMVGKLCPQLQHIDLGGLCGITDSGFLAFLGSCFSGLVKVNLAGCINLTDAAVSTLVRLHGDTLQSLNLDGCRKVADKSLEAIADNCPLLRDLDMSRCMVTDDGISALANGMQLDLEILSLSGCSQVSDNSMPFLQDLGRSLVGLNLQQCNLISRIAVDLLGEQLWRCDILF